MSWSISWEHAFGEGANLVLGRVLALDLFGSKCHKKKDIFFPAFLRRVFVFMPLPPFAVDFATEPHIETLAKKHSLLFLSVREKPQAQEQTLDNLLGKPIARARQQAKKFKARQGQLLDVSGFPPQGKLGRVVLLGTEKSSHEVREHEVREHEVREHEVREHEVHEQEAHKKSAPSPSTLSSAKDGRHRAEERALSRLLFSQGATLLARVRAIGAEEALWIYDGRERGMFLQTPDALSEGALGAMLASYRFDTYLSDDDEEALESRTLSLQKLTLSLSGAQFETKARDQAWARCQAAARGVCLARDLVNEPPNALNPQTFTERLLALPKAVGKGLRVEVLDEKMLEKLGFRALLAVARASEHAARVVVMSYTPPKKDTRAPLVLVGKGVTFDSGGLSLKPAGSMEDMKMDMGGAAAVAGAMTTIALQQPHRACVGIVGLVENMPGGNAQRPGDIVRTLSGKTVEVLNTDAEGRLVLADLLWYAQQRWQPCAMVNLATLTGAMIVALGEEYAGFFANDDALAGRLESCSKKTGEKIWRLPLDAAYDALLRSPVADMKNIGGGGAGSITAAQFLQRFVRSASEKEDGSKTCWAHIDIAGVTWATKARLGRPRGASGFGVRLLASLAERLASENLADFDAEGRRE